MRVSRAAPLGTRPPVGHLQHTLCLCSSASGRRLGHRVCLRKGCGGIFRAQCWNQRYCQDPTCLKLVHRWQAAKRQKARRRCPEVRAAHAAAERRRRARRAQGRQKTPSPPASAPDDDPTPAENQGAWSRGKNFSAPFCDRPGCYQPVRASCRRQARYCSDDCRGAVRRVRDRERKWLVRNTPAGRFKRRCEYQAGRCTRRARSP